MANENPEIKTELTDACREARSAGNEKACSSRFDLVVFIPGESIKRITSIEHDTFGKPLCVSDRQSMVQAARGLLSAVTRVLLLADMVVVKQIIHIKKKV